MQYGKMDIDNLLSQMDTYARQDQCSNCRSLHEQIELLVEVVKAKEKEINELQEANTKAVESAKAELRSQAEKKLRESLALYVHAYLKRELKSKVIDEMNNNILEHLTPEYRKALEEQFKAALMKEANENAMAKVEGLVYQRVAAEKAYLRLKVKEYQQLKEYLQDKSELKQIEERYRRYIQNITLQRTNEISSLTAKNAELKKQLSELSDKYYEEIRAFGIEKGNVERELELRSRYIAYLSDELYYLKYRPQMSDLCVQMSQYSGESRCIQTSGVFTPQVCAPAQALNKDIYPEPATPLVKQLYVDMQLSNQRKSAFSGPERAQAATDELLDNSINNLQNTSPRRAEALFPGSGSHAADLRYTPSQALNALQKRVSACFEQDRLEQIAYKQLPEIILPSNQLGQMLGSAFTFLFDYYDRCETAYAHRNKFVHEMNAYISGRKYDIALKSIQAELLHLRNLDRECKTIYDMIRYREATKARGMDIEFDRRLVQRLEGRTVLYRGLDYWDVLRAERVVQ